MKTMVVIVKKMKLKNESFWFFKSMFINALCFFAFKFKTKLW